MIHPPQALAGVVMRGADETSGSLFSYVDLEARIPARHPLRKIRQVVNDALASLDTEFEALYIDFGRPSIPPERLIRASLIQILFSVRSERQLMEQMEYNLLFRWFVGLCIDDLPRRRTGRRPLRLDDGRQQPRPATPVAGGVPHSGQPGHDPRGPDQGPRPCQRPESGKTFRFGD
jgi:hypothetical protein